MIVDENHFSLEANVNVNNTDLDVLHNKRIGNTVGDTSVRRRGVTKKCWTLTKIIFEVKDRKSESFQGNKHHYSRRNVLDTMMNARYYGRSMSKQPVNQYL